MTRELIVVALLAFSALPACGSDDSTSGGGSGGSGAADASSDAKGGVPKVTITAPTENQVLKLGEAVTLKGSAVDPEDGAITDAAKLLWFSNMAPDPVGEGEEHPTDPSEIPPGTTEFTLSATDSDGNEGSATVHVTFQ